MRIMILMMLCSIVDVIRIIPDAFRYATWSAIIGILLSCAVPLIILAVVLHQRPNVRIKGSNYLICGILFILLMSQFIPLLAALSLRGQVSKLEGGLNEVVMAIGEHESVSAFASSD